MFSGSNSGQNSVDGVGGSVPMRFVWPYGGRRVYLTGSFTRWSEFIQMVPMEGCPTVFQAIFNLIPGYHQFKFFVDGQYRHDEHQPFVSCNVGVVNTVLLSREPESRNSILNSDASISGNSMDVDNENSRFGEILKISQSDLEVSRSRISEFLSMETAYKMMPDSGKEVVLDVDLAVEQAFHILYQQGACMAPLWDSHRGQFAGILSPLDFILILKELGNHGSNLTEEELETHTIAAWKQRKPQMRVDGQGRVLPRCLIHADPDDSLKDVALKILQNDVAAVPVIRSSLEFGSFPDLLYLASLCQILKCICRHFRHISSSVPIFQKPISALTMGTWVPKIGEPNRRSLAMLKPNASLNTALSLLVQAQVSSIPIVDDNDSLLDIYSRSDITALAKDRAYARIHLDEMSIQLALQHGQDANSPFGVFNGQRCQMCLHSDSLMKVMERLSNPGVRRVIIVEAGSKCVEGIISLSDVFKFLLG